MSEPTENDTRPFVAPGDLPSSRKYLIFAVMAFGQFMALLDIQIVAASLNEVQAGLSAGPDEISWVQTGYLMAELVMIPFSGFLAQALSTRWLFALSAGLFTLSSALCGMATDINSMVAFRVVQGFVGGAMVPMVFATGFALFSGPQRAMIPAILGMVGVLAPTLGPTVGGWLTGAVGWRSIFYVNIAPGIAVTVLAILFIRVDRPKLSLLKTIDYSHLAAMAVFLAGLGLRCWRKARATTGSAVARRRKPHGSTVGFLLFMEPLVRSRRTRVCNSRPDPFRRPTFAMACLFNLVIGFRALFIDLPGAGVPRPGQRRLELAQDRHDGGGGRLRPGDVGGGGRQPFATGRPADRHHSRLDAVRRQPVDDVIRHAPMGIRRAAVAPGPARVCHHAVHRPQRPAPLA